VNLVTAKQELAVLKQRLSRTNLVTGTGLRALNELEAAADSLVRQRRMRNWTLAIDPSTPLEFRGTETRSTRLRLQVDLFGIISSTENGLPSGKHSITVRLWSLERKDWFDPHMDSAELVRNVERGLGRRVILRFRFDYARSVSEYRLF